MHKLLTSIAAASALALLASASLACEFHERTASAAGEEVVAMSTAASPRWSSPRRDGASDRMPGGRRRLHAGQQVIFSSMS